MTFYLQTYPFDFAQGTPYNRLQQSPYRRMARRWVQNNEQTLGVNIREEDDAYILSALVPGLKSEHINIQVLDDVVHIEGEYKMDDSDYLVRELPNGSFTRTLRLPTAIDADHVEAKITDGILNLNLPKAESARPKKIKIAVK